MSRTVIITGGSSGIGKALGAALVARGDDVVLAARTEADVRCAAGELSAQGPGKARGAVLDVRNADEVADLVNDVYRSSGRLDLMTGLPACAAAIWTISSRGAVTSVSG